MLKIKEAVIVEGKYDKQRLSEFLDAPIVTTSGFRVFSDKEKQALIRKLALERGLVVMTDSDSAGFVIRNFLRGIVPPECIKHCYIPQIKGKEKRKDTPSKEGFLGVEGLNSEILAEALYKCGVVTFGDGKSQKRERISKSDLYEWGLSGRENSTQKRKELLKLLGLPEYMTTNALLEILNSVYSKQEILDKVEKL